MRGASLEYLPPLANERIRIIAFTYQLLQSGVNTFSPTPAPSPFVYKKERGDRYSSQYFIFKVLSLSALGILYICKVVNCKPCSKSSTSKPSATG